MIALDNGDKIQGDTTTASKVDYTLHGIVGTTVTQLADGQLPSSIGDLYTAGATVSVLAIILVNTNTTTEAVNLYLTPSGGTARKLIPQDMSLGADHSLHTDGKTIQVLDTLGEILTTEGRLADGELKLTPKPSSSGAEGTVFYDSDDDHVYVATE